MYENLNSRVIFINDRNHIFYATIRAFIAKGKIEVAFFKGDSKINYFKIAPHSSHFNCKVVEPLDPSLIIVKQVFVINRYENIVWNYRIEEEKYSQNFVVV